MPGAGDKRQSDRERRRGGHTRKRIGFKIAAVIAAVAIVLIIGGYAVFHHYYSLIGQKTAHQAEKENFSALSEEQEESPAEPATEDEIKQIEDDLRRNLEQMEQNSGLYTTDAFNILLVGVDSRSDSFSGRSDSMILISIDKKTKQVTMTSFLRDIYLSVPGYRSTRINEAYARGGTDLLTDTIQENFGIKVDRCVVVNFYLVMDLVDAVGGIDLDLSADEIRVMNMYINNQNQLLDHKEGTDILTSGDAGIVHVNGNQALAYARVRYIGTDFARTGRQRTVINKCMDKIKQMNLREINEMAEEFLPRVSTDLTEGDCAALLLMALKLSDYKMQTMAIPVDGTWNYANIRGMSVITVDFSANTKAWYELVEGGGSE